MLPRTLLYCLVSGLIFAFARIHTIVPSLGLVWLWLEGTALATAFFVVVRWGPQNRIKLFVVIWPVFVVVGVLTLHSEAVIFTTLSSAELLVFLRDDLLAFTALTIALVFLAGPLQILQSSPTSLPARPGYVSLGLRVVVCGLAYLIFYFVFGGIVYELLTKPYFEENPLLRTGEEAVLSLGAWFPLIQVVRGVLMVAASLPLIFLLRMSRRNAAITLGIIFWVVGGLAPLLIPGEHMPSMQRFYHIIEILCQNGCLGLVAVWLLRPKARLTS